MKAGLLCKPHFGPTAIKQFPRGYATVGRSGAVREGDKVWLEIVPNRPGMEKQV